MSVKFKVCPNCGLHGHFEIDGDQLAPEATSRDEALQQLAELTEKSMVTAGEAHQLREEIGASSLRQTKGETIRAFLDSPMGPLFLLVTALGIEPVGTARRADVFG